MNFKILSTNLVNEIFSFIDYKTYLKLCQKTKTFLKLLKMDINDFQLFHLIKDLFNENKITKDSFQSYYERLYIQMNKSSPEKINKHLNLFLNSNSYYNESLILKNKEIKTNIQLPHFSNFIELNFDFILQINSLFDIKKDSFFEKNSDKIKSLFVEILSGTSIYKINNKEAIENLNYILSIGKYEEISLIIKEKNFILKDTLLKIKLNNLKRLTLTEMGLTSDDINPFFENIILSGEKYCLEYLDLSNNLLNNDCSENFIKAISGNFPRLDIIILYKNNLIDNKFTKEVFEQIINIRPNSMNYNFQYLVKSKYFLNYDFDEDKVFEMSNKIKELKFIQLFGSYEFNETYDNVCKVLNQLNDLSNIAFSNVLFSDYFFAKLNPKIYEKIINLQITSCKFDETGFKFISKFKNLSILSIEKTEIPDNILNNFCNYISLNKTIKELTLNSLRFNENQFNKIINEIKYLNELEKLSIPNNILSQNLIKKLLDILINNCKGLTYLDISKTFKMNSDFSNEFWENIFKLKYLKELKIQNVELINQDLENISQIFEEDFTILEKLDISYNYGISESVLKKFLLTVKKEKPEIIYIIYEGSCRIKEEAIQDLYKILPGRIRIIPIKY